MTEPPRQQPVSPRLAALLTVMLDNPAQTYTVSDLARQAQIPLGTISSLINRASSYGWVTSQLESNVRRYRVVYTAGRQIRDALDAAADRTSRAPATVPNISQPRPKTLAELMATETPELVESVCAKLGWASPFEGKGQASKNGAAPKGRRRSAD